MKINYCLNGAWLSDPLDRSRIFKLLHDAGVTDVWLWGYFFGRFMNSMEELKQSKQWLEEADFSVGIISLPVGHPGETLDPTLPEMILHLPDSWHYRHDRNGNPVKHCADIDEIMIKDNVDAIITLKDAGFSRIFFDDDCRMGNAGQELQGCFCDSCISEFINNYPNLPETFNREFLSSLIAEDLKMKRNHTRTHRIFKKNDNPTLRDIILQHWSEFNCNKVNKLLKSCSIPGIELGLMVMVHGDERHGININQIHRNHPKLLFRVGEEHFSDKSFGTIRGKAEEWLAIQTHQTRMQGHDLYSETTEFPPGALSPSNWVVKAQLSLILGIPNLFLMNGVQFIEEKYWVEMANHQENLRELNKWHDKSREYPVHIAFGTEGWRQTSLLSPSIPIVAGLPAKPVRISDIEHESNKKVIIIGQQEFLDKRWLNAISDYEMVITDIPSFQLENLLKPYTNKIPKIALNVNIFKDITQSSKFNAIQRKWLNFQLKETRSEFRKNNWFPFITQGIGVGLVWIPSIEKILLQNLCAESNSITLSWNNSEIPLKFLSFEWKSIDLRFN